MTPQPTLALLLVLLAGCASESQLLKPAEIADPFPLRLQAASAEGVRVTLEHVIVRSGPGSWVRDADWDEYVVVLRNDGTQAVTVRSIEIASEGLASSRHTTDREALESSSRANLDTLKSIGMAVTVGATALTGAAVVAGAATASAVSAFWGGTAAAGGTMFVTVVPIIGVIGGGLYAYKGPHARLAGDRAAVAYEMERSGLRLPASLGPASELRGSAFFPVTPAPTRLHVRYEVQGETRELALDLNALSALHLTARKP